MIVMDLGNIFKKQKQEEPENFWSLVISKSWVEAGIWRVVGDKTEVIAEGTGASWQEDNAETLLQAADSTLSAAAGSIEDEGAQEPNKVVFGLPPSWVEEGSIKKEKLELLRKLSSELELTPAGFVVQPEAIVHYLKVSEGAPPNAILVGVLEDSVDITLVQNGKIQGTSEVGRSMSLAADVSEGLARFPALEQYPSRLLLYNHRVADLEEAKQNLLEAEWSEGKIHFLHTPKVEVLAENVAISAVSLAGGAEVGHATALAVAQEVSGEVEVAEAALDVEGGDVEQEEELRKISARELGFLEGQDVAQAAPPPEPKVQEALEEKPTQRQFLAQALQKLAVIPQFFSSLRLPAPRSLGGGRSILAVVVLLLLGLLVAGSLAYWYLPKAHITVYVAPQKLERKTSLGVSPEASVVNFEARIIPGRLAKAEVAGEQTKGTTGTKTVGERAKGGVVIFRSGSSLTLASGTLLASKNGLKFTLNEDIRVASGSGTASPGQTEAQVTAVDIGAQYNLAGDTLFSVGNFSEGDLQAKNSQAFPGGTSREVAAVSEEDRESLEEELTAELKEQALAKLRGSLVENEVLLEATLELNPLKRDFSHKVGEEAGTLKLSLQAGAEALVVPKEDLGAFLVSRLEKDVPQGYVLRQEQINAEFGPPEEGEFPVQVSANLLPSVSTDEITRAVAGKYPDVAKEYLSTIPGYTRAEISLSLSFPGKLRTLPRIERNIVVEIVAER